MSRITVETIARMANVSVGTVDRALNNRGRIREETRQRILEIAQELNYQPNKLASALGRQHKFRIAAVTPYNPHYFHQHIYRGLERARREIADYGATVDIIPTETMHVEHERPVLEGLDKSVYDGVVLNAGGDALAPSINAFVEAGIPVVTFNSDAKESLRSFFIGENAEKSGSMAGDMMGRLLGGQGTVAVLSSYFHPGAAMDRRNGFLKALERYPDIRVVGDYVYEDDDELAYSIVQKAMSNFPDLSGIFSNSAAGAVACSHYALDHRSEPLPVLIGYDVTESVEKCLTEGLFDMAIDQQPDQQSYYAVMLMYRHLAEKWTPTARELEIRVNMVMRFNAHEHALARERQEGIIL